LDDTELATESIEKQAMDNVPVARSAREIAEAIVNALRSHRAGAIVIVPEQEE